MKLKNKVLAIFIFACSLISCDQNSKQVERVTAASTVIDKGDSIYFSLIKFRGIDFELIMKKTCKYKQDDTAEILLNQVAHFRHGYKKPFRELQTPAGIKYSFQLPNNTMITVNSCSRLILQPLFPKYFELNGEAYFVIEEDSTVINVDSKFKILANKGSKINVTAYQDTSSKYLINVALVEGHAFLINGKSKRTLSKKGSKAIYIVDEKKFVIGETDVEDVLVWTNNSFGYGHIDHLELLQRICRWYKLELVIPKNFPPDTWGFGGNFSFPISVPLQSLNSGSDDILYEVYGNKLIVSAK